MAALNIGKGGDNAKSIGKMSRRVIMAGGEGVGVFVRASSGMVRERMIPWSVPNFDAQLIAVLTGNHRNRPVEILYDAVDQHYRKEVLPKVGAMDRPKILKRKLDQAFPSYPVRAHLELKGVGSKTQPQYLFAAIAENEPINRITDALRAAGSPIAGLGLLPVESAGLVNMLARKTFTDLMDVRSSWAILIGQHETGGLRQIVIKDGQLALTRLTPIAEGSMDGMAWVEEVSREFKATMGYISRFGFNANDGLDVIVVGGENEKRAFVGRGLPANNFAFLTVAEAARAIGLQLGGSAGGGHFSDILHAGYNGAKTKLVMPVPVPAIKRVAAPRQAVNAATVFACLGIAGLGYFVFDDYTSYVTAQRAIESARAQKNILQREYDQEARIFEQLPIKIDVVRGSIAIRRVLDANSHDLTSFLNVLDTNLDADMRVRSFKVDFAPGEQFPVTGSGTLEKEQPKANTRTPARPKAKARTAAKTDASGKPIDYDSGQMKAVFRVTLPPQMELEEKVRRADAFAERLRQSLPDHTVSILSQFANVEQGGNFQGTAGERAAQQESGRIATQDIYAEFEITGRPL